MLLNRKLGRNEVWSLICSTQSAADLRVPVPLVEDAVKPPDMPVPRIVHRTARLIAHGADKAKRLLLE